MQSEFEKNGCLLAIKRKERIFEPFIEEYLKKTVKLKESILIQSLDNLVKIIKEVSTTRLLLINSRPEFNKLFELVAHYLNCNVKLTKTIPGTFTNPSCKYYIQPKAIFITHDRKQKQAVSESKKAKIKIIGFDNIVKGVVNYDVCAILNNFSIKSMAYGFWYIINEYKKSVNAQFKSFQEFYTELNA